VPRAKAQQAEEEPLEPLEQTGDSQQQPPESDEGSSRASSASDFIADPGPEFDPGQAGQDAKARDEDRVLSVAPGGETGIEVQWDPAVVKSMLQAQGSALHAVAGKAEQDWIYTKDELSAIAPPLTRILNRYDATRVAAATGDELALILGLTGHTMRSLQERKTVLDAIKAAEEAAEQQAERFGPQPPITQEPPTP
jgi:hypothetical protein